MRAPVQCPDGRGTSSESERHRVRERCLLFKCVNRGVDAALGIHTSSASNRVRANACMPGTLVPRTTRIHAINVRTRHYARRRTRTGRCGRECQASVRRPALNRSLRSRGARGASVARVPQARRRRAGHPGGRPHAAQQREGVGAARHGERTRHVPAARRAYIRAGRLYTHGQLCRSAARTRLAEFYWLPGAGGPRSFCEGAKTAPADRRRSTPSMHSLCCPSSKRSRRPAR